MGKRSALVQTLDRAHPYVCAGALGAVGLAHTLGYTNISDRFTSVSYPTPSQDGGVVYGQGWNDLCFISFMICSIALFRSVYRATVLKTTASLLKLSRGSASKWLDCGWVGLYFVFSVSWALSIFRNEPWFMDTKHFWIGYPHTMDYNFKTFYLTQLSFWLTNLCVFFIEAQRRDWWQFLVHHVVTIGLVYSSYVYQFHRVGAAILMILDVGDAVYYHVKMIKYARCETAATIAFGLFMAVWFVTRHVLYAFILYSIWFEFPRHLGIGYVASNGVVLSNAMWAGFSGALLALQGLLLFWFVMIVRLAVRVLRGGEAADETDGDEEDEEEEEEVPSVTMTMMKKEEEDITTATSTSSPAPISALKRVSSMETFYDSQGNLMKKDGADIRTASPPETKKSQ